MSTNESASGRIDLNDPVFQYRTGSPPPLFSIDQGDITEALAQLEAAARLATVPDPTGKRWVPGLSIVVVARESDQNRVLYCKGHGVRSVNGTALVGPETLFPCASLSKPVSTTLLTAAGVQEAPGWIRSWSSRTAPAFTTSPGHPRRKRPCGSG